LLLINALFTIVSKHYGLAKPFRDSLLHPESDPEMVAAALIFAGHFG
jgi:hypothetical protein